MQRVHDWFIAQGNAKAMPNQDQLVAQMLLTFKNIIITTRLEFSEMLNLPK